MRVVLLASLVLVGVIAAELASAESVFFVTATTKVSQARFSLVEAVNGELPSPSLYKGRTTYSNGRQARTASFETVSDTTAFAGGTAWVFALNYKLYNPLFTPNPAASEDALEPFRLPAMIADRSTFTDRRNDVYTLAADTALIGMTGFRLEARADDSLSHKRPALQDINGNFVLAEFTGDAAPTQPKTLLLWGTIATILGFFLRRRGQPGPHTL